MNVEKMLSVIQVTAEKCQTINEVLEQDVFNPDESTLIMITITSAFVQMLSSEVAVLAAQPTTSAAECDALHNAMVYLAEVMERGHDHIHRLRTFREVLEQGEHATVFN